MKTFEKYVPTVQQFIKFGLVGISNTFIFLLIYYIFIFINPKLYLIGNTVGFFVSVLNAYYWNNKYVFKKKEKGNLKALIKTFISYGSTFLLSTILLYFWVNYLDVNKAIAPIINLFITIPLNFLLNKLWAFK